MPIFPDRRVRIWLFSSLLATASLGLVLGPITDLASIEPPLQIPWWVMAASFALTDVVVVHLHLRRDAHSISLMELPLLVGLAFLSPLALLTARLAGGVIALVGHRRQEPTKLMFNLSLFAAEVCAALILYRWVLADGSPDAPLGWIAAVVAVTGSTLVGTTGVTIAIWLYEGSGQREMLKEALTIGAVLPLGTTAIGLLVVTILWNTPLAVVPLVVATFFLTAGYRGYVSLKQRHANLQMLHRFTSATARSGETRLAATEMLSEVRSLLRCEVAELTLLGEDGAVALRIRLCATSTPGDASPIECSDDDIRWLRHAAATDPTMIREGEVAASELERFLGGVGVREALVAPLRRPSAEAVSGLLVVVNRTDMVSSFDDEDAELLSSLAEHAAVALANARLVERLRQEAAEKAYQASHDTLTGLPNRVLLQSRLELALAAVQDHAARAAVLMVDLDGFKAVNDTHGHAVGDLLLQDVASRLQDAVRPGDTVARLGGDEFAIVLPGIDDASTAEAIAEGILAALAEPCVLAGKPIDLRASIGIAFAPDDSTDGEVLLRRADAAMYVAKNSGMGLARSAPTPT